MRDIRQVCPSLPRQYQEINIAAALEKRAYTEQRILCAPVGTRNSDDESHDYSLADSLHWRGRLSGGHAHLGPPRVSLCSCLTFRLIIQGQSGTGFPRRLLGCLSQAVGSRPKWKKGRWGAAVTRQYNGRPTVASRNLLHLILGRRPSARDTFPGPASFASLTGGQVGSQRGLSSEVTHLRRTSGELSLLSWQWGSRLSPRPVSAKLGV